MNRPIDLVEIDLRGRFLMMSTDIEWSLLHIMVHSAPYKSDQVRKFKDLKTMGNKIEATISDVKRLKPKVYSDYEAIFNQLYELKEMRDIIAHKKILFDESNGFTSFRVLFVDDDNGEERMFEKIYTVAEIKSFINRFVNINLSLAEIVDSLRKGLY